MNSREKIIEAIRQNKPGDLPLPSLHFYGDEREDLLAKFTHTLSGIGGYCSSVQDYEQINSLLFPQQEQKVTVINAVKELPGYNVNGWIQANAKELESTEVFIVKGSIAVAENGAIWVSEKDLGNRLLPFLCRQLAIVVEENDLVANMHEAYKKIAIDKDGYGVFIAGPSKTADIEQSLVIGAHGPLSLQVFIIRK